MQIDESGAVEVVEPETELVLVTGRRIDTGELFWPEEDSLYLLASTWQAVDPLDDDSDSISCVVINPTNLHMAHRAEQALIELGLVPQTGGILWRAVGSLGASDVFQGVLPRVALFLSQQEALGACWCLVLLCEVGEEAHEMTYNLVGCAMAADIQFSPIP